MNKAVGILHKTKEIILIRIISIFDISVIEDKFISTITENKKVIPGKISLNMLFFILVSKACKNKSPNKTKTTTLSKSI